MKTDIDFSTFYFILIVYSVFILDTIIGKNNENSFTRSYEFSVASTAKRFLK